MTPDDKKKLLAEMLNGIWGHQDASIIADMLDTNEYRERGDNRDPITNIIFNCVAEGNTIDEITDNLDHEAQYLKSAGRGIIRYENKLLREEEKRGPHGPASLEQEDAS